MSQKTNGLKQQSLAMLMSRYLGLDKLAWSLRRLHCPVSKEALVLEVGSGNNPYPRSNVLLDAYEDTPHRGWTPLVNDRPTILGFVEKLPFKDKAFDFVIASHVLEHSPDPGKFLAELSRVAKGGYIEVPDAFTERVNPFRNHRLEITLRKDTLLISKKPFWIVDQELIDLYEDRAKPVFVKQCITSHPFEFHVRFYWQNNIKSEVINPDTDAGWPDPPPRCIANTATNWLSALRNRSREVVLMLLRQLLSQRDRNRTIDIMDLLQCPICDCADLTRKSDHITCDRCNSSYPLSNGIPVMKSSKEAVRDKTP